ncbi:MAG: hypothetical protein ABUK01_17925 [Leptospirales bacterium]
MIEEDNIINTLNEEHIQFLEKIVKLSKEKQSRYLKAFNESLIDD